MASEAVLELTDSNFEQEVLKSDLPVLVDFWAEWCAPCRMIAPTIEELATAYQGKAKVGKMDTDASKDTAIKYNIDAIPTIILFKDGQESHRFVGMTTRQQFADELDKITG